MIASAKANDAIQTSKPHSARLPWLLAAGCFTLFLSLAIGYSFTRSPWWDEGVYADIALTFRNYGHLGATIFQPFGYLNLPQANRYTYTQLPLYLVTLGSFWRIAPVSVVSMRLFSVLWGCVYVASWFFLVRALSGRNSLALFVASVVSLDYSCIAAASDGRMDMMCAALGQAGIAAYAWFRESRWTLGVVLAGWFGAASLFSHPLGIVTNISIAALGLLDWQRIQWKGLAASALPYIIGTVGCLLYVMQAPSVFWAQARAASGYRISGFLPLVNNLVNDIYLRYADLYFLGLAGVNKLKGFSLLFVLVGVIGLAANRRLRTTTLGRALLLLACIGYFGVAAVDNQKFPVYFVYSTPAMAACGAVWVWDCWWRGGPLRVAAVTLLAGAIGATAGAFACKIWANDYEHLYKAAIRVVQADLPANGLVMGGSELGFALGFRPNLVDDRYLGYFTGKKPDVYVENVYYGMGESTLTLAWARARQTLSKEYRLVFANRAYKIYVRTAS